MSKQSIIENIAHYVAELNQIFKAGNATEHSYRLALQRLLENITTGLTVTNEPKRIACGAPDYIVTRKEIPVGYIEAKDIDTDLNNKANKLQFDRYKQSLNNLIITDYLNFQLFENGELITSVKIAKTGKNGIEADKTQFEAFIALINLFAGYQGQGILTSVQLSKVMAAKARLMANIIENVLDNKGIYPLVDDNNSLYGQLKGFREVLIHDIKHREFSDIYAQTIAHGMFAAKLNETSPTPSKGGEPTPSPWWRIGEGLFTRYKAAQLIPHSNPFLRKFFQYIAGYDLDDQICWVVDDLADLFNYVDVNAINKEFHKSDHDPIIHFYETFLAEYDPRLRKSRGVWYTPKPAVQFIVQAVDDILKQDFCISQGIADTSKIDNYHRVQILDPATGTGTFLTEIIQNIYQRFKNQQGMWQNYAREHLLPRINGFEILMVSYAMAHLKLDMLLQQTGYKYSGNERLPVFLTNSLEQAQAKTETLFAKWLSDEANEASHIKQNVPVMVVLGNPPYNVSTQNKNSWIDRLIEEYKHGLNEKKLNLDDDYIKFIRYGQHYIEKNGDGVLAYISNNSFIDGITHRQMRKSLLETFDKIYILDLHGSGKKKETAPDGSKDENVFDIMQGVSINIFVKSTQKTQNKLAVVYHSDLYGKRNEKYSFLLNNTLQTIQWKRIDNKSPYFFFVPKSEDNKEEYEKGFKINELFIKNVSGFQTKRDKITIHFTPEELSKIKKIFSSEDQEGIRTTLNLPEDGRDWTIKNAQNDIKNNNPQTIKVMYRPFDDRYTFFTGRSKGFVAYPRTEIAAHLLNHENFTLITCRQQSTFDFQHIFVSRLLSDMCNISSQTKETGYIFPLYLYPETDNVFSENKRKPNLNSKIINEISKRLGLQFTEEKASPPLEGAGGGSFAPVDVLDYIYAVLHSHAYRKKYKEFLKIDFPCVPFPESTKQFWKLVGLGGKLRCLHLLEGVEPQEGLANFPIAGNNEVEMAQYVGVRVFINETQYFEHVPLEAWNFYIGGYQPAQKWLKDRKGRALNYDDIVHYQKMIWVLKETGEVMKIIEKV